MSTTRLHSRPAPATEGAGLRADGSALILVAHGDRGGDRSNGALRAHAARLAQSAQWPAVEIALLSGAPRLEDAVENLRHFDHIHVFPMLMSEGYFTDTVIPDRLGRGTGSERFVLHRPLGRSAELTRLATDEALKGCSALGFASGEVTVLLAGHGAKSNSRARLAIEVHASEMRSAGIFSAVATAYLEEPPFLQDMMGRLEGPTVVVGMFASDGLHAGEDLPEAMEQSLRAPAYYTGAIGAHPKISDIVAHAVAAHAMAGDQSLECRSVVSSSARKSASA